MTVSASSWTFDETSQMSGKWNNKKWLCNVSDIMVLPLGKVSTHTQVS